VLDRLPRPSIVTADELADYAINQLAGVDLRPAAKKDAAALQNEHPDIWMARERFLSFIGCATRAEIEGSYEIEFGGGIDLGCWSNTGELPDSVDFDGLWEAPGFELIGRGKKSFTGYLGEAWFIATCSHQAMKQAENEFKPIIESIAKTVRYSAATREEERLTYLTDGEGGSIFRMCLSAYAGNLRSTTLKDDVIECLGNAVRCLSEADNQGSNELALSQCFAAVESMICQGHEDKSKQISGFVPTLLQPAGLGRTAKGVVLKKLYDWRSKVVHGAVVNVNQSSREWVRRIASGMIRALVRWRAFQERMEKETTHKRLIDDLRSAAGDGKEVVQIGVDLSMLLPDDACQRFRVPGDDFDPDFL
jgi:hypothetical protein